MSVLELYISTDNVSFKRWKASFQTEYNNETAGGRLMFCLHISSYLLIIYLNLLILNQLKVSFNLIFLSTKHLINYCKSCQLTLS